jgi:hypothetical protein
MLNGLRFQVLTVHRLFIGRRAVAEDTMLKRADHIDGHTVLEAFIADDNLLLQELVGDQILWPADDTCYGTAQIGACTHRTLLRAKIKANVKDITVLRIGRAFCAHMLMLRRGIARSVQSPPTCPMQVAWMVPVKSLALRLKNRPKALFHSK